jgi:hypothetical protein
VTKTRALCWVFPTGVILTLGGVLLSALREWDSFNNIPGWAETIRSPAWVFMLFLGALLAIVGSFLERRRLPITETRPRGLTCWIACVISLFFMLKGSNFHNWRVIFIFPAFVGFASGAVLLSKLSEHSKRS